MFSISVKFFIITFMSKYVIKTISHNFTIIVTIMTPLFYIETLYHNFTTTITIMSYFLY